MKFLSWHAMLASRFPNLHKYRYIVKKIWLRNVCIRSTRRENAFTRMYQGKSSRSFSDVSETDFVKIKLDFGPFWAQKMCQTQANLPFWKQFQVRISNQKRLTLIPVIAVFIPKINPDLVHDIRYYYKRSVRNAKNARSLSLMYVRNHVNSYR